MVANDKEKGKKRKTKQCHYPPPTFPLPFFSSFLGLATFALEV